MPEYKVRVSEARAKVLKEDAEARDLPIHMLLAQIVEGDTPTPARNLSFDEAADVFLAHLEPEHRKLIEDCAKDTARTPASYILSYIKLVHEQGSTARVLPEATDPTTVPDTPSDKSCEWCHRPLEDRHARFCPTPEDGTESCGRLAGLAALRAARQKELASGLPMPTVMDRTIKVR